MARSSVTMSAADSSRREFASAAAAAVAGLGFAQGAKADVGAKFSFFGLTKGQASSMSEGAAYGTDQGADIYSPYGPYSKPSEETLYNSVDNTAFYTTVCLNSEKRFVNYPKYIEKKAWIEITDENTRYLYSLRKAMNGLSKTKEQKALAKKVFVDLEGLTYGAKVKSQEQCTAAFESLKVDFAAFKSAVGI